VDVQILDFCPFQDVFPGFCWVEDVAGCAFSGEDVFALFVGWLGSVAGAG
jgi:hypothetical protein